MLRLLLAAALAAQAPPAPPFPVEGMAELAGVWRLARGDSAAWAAPGYDDSGWRTVAVPAPWSGQGLQGYRGFAWYRFHYTLDSTVEAPLGVRFTGVVAAYEVFVDGRRVGGYGGFPPNYVARSNVPLNLAVPTEAATRGEHVLAVRVYSDERLGGIVGVVFAGPLQALETRDFRYSFLLVSVALLLMGVSVSQFFFWARRPDAVVYLQLFGFVVLLALLYLVWVPAMRMRVGAVLDHYRLYLLFGGLGGALFCFAFRRILEIEHNRLLPAFAWVLGVLGVVGLLLPGWGAVRAAGTVVMGPLFLFGSVYLVVLAAQQVQRGAEHAKALLWGFGVLALALIHDVGSELGLVPGGTRLPYAGTPWVVGGSVVFVLSATFVTTRQMVDRASIALYDRLTGLYRREVVLDALRREIRRAARTRQPLALIMMDIDRFKAVNDSLGHQAGDRVLAEVGRRLTEAGRAVDWLGRYGGEEFLALLAGSDIEGGRQAAERFRLAVAALPVDAGRGTRTITLSAGLAAYDGGSEWPTVETLVGAADAALYRAKEAGRNTVSA